MTLTGLQHVFEQTLACWAKSLNESALQAAKANSFCQRFAARVLHTAEHLQLVAATKHTKFSSTCFIAMMKLFVELGEVRRKQLGVRKMVTGSWQLMKQN